MSTPRSSAPARVPAESRAELSCGMLVVAPLAAELSGFLRQTGARRLDEPRRSRGRRGSVHRCRIGERTVVAAVIGEGAARARASLEELTLRYRPRRALLLGLAGALSPDLEVGSLTRPENVAEIVEGAPRWIAGGAAGDGATVVSVARIVPTAHQKSALWARLGEPSRCVVDLESAGFVDVMERCGVAWAVVRAISDGAAEDLPAELLRASDAGGRVSRFEVVLRSAPRPWRWRRLWVLRSRLVRASESLAQAAAAWALGEEGGR